MSKTILTSGGKALAKGEKIFVGEKEEVSIYDFLNARGIDYIGAMPKITYPYYQSVSGNLKLPYDLLKKMNITTMPSNIFAYYSNEIPQLDYSGIKFWTKNSGVWSNALDNSVAMTGDIVLNLDSLTSFGNRDTSTSPYSYRSIVGYTRLKNIWLKNPIAPTTFNNAFYGNSSLETIVIDNFNTSLGNNTLYYNNCFSECYSLKKIIIKYWTTITVGYNIFNSSFRIMGTTNAKYNPQGLQDGYIYVPDDVLSTVKNVSYFSSIASQIKGLSELPQEDKVRYGINA